MQSKFDLFERLVSVFTMVVSGLAVIFTVFLPKSDRENRLK